MTKEETIADLKNTIDNMTVMYDDYMSQIKKIDDKIAQMKEESGQYNVDASILPSLRDNLSNGLDGISKTLKIYKDRLVELSL